MNEHATPHSDNATQVSLDFPGGWKGWVKTGEEFLFSAEVGHRLTLPNVGTWREWLTRMLDAPVDLPGSMLLKHSDSSPILRARIACKGTGQCAGLDVVVRRFEPRGALARMVAAMRRSEASRLRFKADRLRGTGILTPTPLAELHRRFPFGSSILVLPYVADLTDLDQIVLTLLPRLRDPELNRAKRRLMEAVAELCGLLQFHAMPHRDLKASNVLFRGWDSPNPALVLLDLEGLQFRRGGATSDPLFPVVRLAASLMSHRSLTRTDYLRFLRVLTSCSDWNERDARVLYRSISAAAEDYNRRARLRKKDKLDRPFGE